MKERKEGVSGGGRRGGERQDGLGRGGLHLIGSGDAVGAT
jgi:hypothetical protein